MKNVEISIEGNILTAKVDLSKTFGPSASGKTTIIGTTEGNPTVATIKGRAINLGVNCYTPNK